MTTQQRRKRLIEVAFPLEEVSSHSRREKNVRQGHISILHIWWARRPLAACRAFIYASLVDDPASDDQREELLKEVADLSSWDAVRHPDKVVRAKVDGGSGLTGTKLLRRARQRILDDNGGKPPKLLDPFAGGGAIPLEGLRLGCEVEASDLNPVAVLILKGTVEYPQKYGQSDSRPVPNYIHQAAKDPLQSRFNDGDLTNAYRCLASTTSAGWRRLFLPVHLLFLVPFLSHSGSIAGDVEFQDDRVVDHPVDGRRGCHWVGEDVLPLGEDQIRGDAEGAPFVAFGDEREEHLGLLCTLGQVSQVVQQQEVVVVELS